MQEYMPMIKDALGMFAFLAVELSILFIIISAGVSLLQQYIPDSKIQKLLGASKGRGYLMAAGLGAITPFCTCSTIPMLRGLLKAKAGFGPTLTFLFASPLLNPIIIGLFVATFGLKVTLIYTAFALVLSVVAGVVLHGMGFERHVKPLDGMQSTASCCSSAPAQSSSCCTSEAQSEPAQACCTPEPKQETKQESCCAPAPSLQPLSCCTSAPEVSSCCAPESKQEPKQESCCASKAESTSGSCCGSAPKPQGQSLDQKIRLALVDGYTQFKQVLPYLLLGVTLGSVIYGFVPQDFIATYASGDSLLAVPVAAVIGIPLYVRVEALIPLSAVLVGKGMGLGAVMALIIGGGGASLTEVILLKSLFKWQVIAAFLAVVMIMAVGAGYFFQFFM